MKRLAILFFVLASAACMGSPVRSAAGGKSILFSDITEPPSYTAADYIQDGLVAMWDAIENVGWNEHDDDSAVWIDLVGEKTLTLRNNAHFAADRLVCPNTGAPAFSISPIEGIYSYEIGFMTDVTRGIVIYVRNGQYGYIYNNQYWCNGVPGNNKPSICTLSNWVSKDLCMSFVDSEESGTMTVAYRDGIDITKFGRVDYWRQPNYSLFAIGGYYGNYQNPDDTGTIRGHVRYVRLYSRALTPLEVQYNHVIDSFRFGVE